MSAEEIESKLGQLDFSDLEIDSDTDSDSGDDNEQSTLSQASKPLASKPLEKEDIVTKYADKIKTEPFKRGHKLQKIDQRGQLLSKFWMLEHYDFWVKFFVLVL